MDGGRHQIYTLLAHGTVDQSGGRKQARGIGMRRLVARHHRNKLKLRAQFQQTMQRYARTSGTSGYVSAARVWSAGLRRAGARRQRRRCRCTFRTWAVASVASMAASTARQCRGSWVDIAVVGEGGRRYPALLLRRPELFTGHATRRIALLCF